MCNRHELTALHPNEAVQTSALEIQPDPEISGMIISRRDEVKKPSGNQTVFYTTSGSELPAFKDNRRFWPLETNNDTPGEVLDTSDPLPLQDFGPVIGIFSAIVLAAMGVGIVLGIMSLIEWIRFDLYLLPLGVTW